MLFRSEVLEALKDQEEFEVERAKLEGREPRVYHGVFATHPSNDQRLQEVVKEAQTQKAVVPTIGRSDYLAHIDGLVFGDSVKQGIRHANKFYHKDLGIALTFPEGWRIENRPDRLLAISPKRTGQMLVKLEDLNRRISPSEFMRERLKLNNLKQAGTLQGTGLPSYTGVARMPWSFGAGPSRKLDTRVALLFFRDKAYVFYGASTSQEQFNGDDRLFLETARSLHALTSAEQQLAEGLRIRLIDVSVGSSFAKLSANSPIPNYPEKILRLLNDKYPQGEPQPGSKLKIVQ